MINLVKIGCIRAHQSLCRVAVAVFVVVATLFASGCDVINDSLPTYEQSSIVKQGDYAPAFVAQTIDGESVVVGGESDSPLLLILFSHTCPDCKNLFTALQDAIDSGVNAPDIIAVSRGGTLDDIRAYRAENGFSFRMVADESTNIYYLYAEAYVPRCYVIDRHGVVQFMTYEYTPGDVELLFDSALSL
jgi:peroxiredoxin